MSILVENLEIEIKELNQVILDTNIAIDSWEERYKKLGKNYDDLWGQMDKLERENKDLQNVIIGLKEEKPKIPEKTDAPPPKPEPPKSEFIKEDKRPREDLYDFLWDEFSYLSKEDLLNNFCDYMLDIDRDVVERKYIEMDEKRKKLKQEIIRIRRKNHLNYEYYVMPFDREKLDSIKDIVEHISLGEFNSIEEVDKAIARDVELIK